MTRTGECACGAVRFQVVGDPVRLVVCHCKACQRRTGSAFGIGCIFPKDAVTIEGDEMGSYERTAESGNSVRFHFCKSCGTNVIWDLGVLPGKVAVAGGLFDDTDWIDPQLHVWAKAAQRWTPIPDHVVVLEESNVAQVARTL